MKEVNTIKAKIRIDTLSDAEKFSKIASLIDGKVLITDGNGLCVNGKSFIGALHAVEFSELWLESDKELYPEFREFIIM